MDRKQYQKLKMREVRARLKLDPQAYEEYLAKERERNKKRYEEPEAKLKRALYRESRRGSVQVRINCLNRACKKDDVNNLWENGPLEAFLTNSKLECYYFGILMQDYFAEHPEAYGQDRIIDGSDYGPNLIVPACFMANELRNKLGFTVKEFRLICTPIRAYVKTKRFFKSIKNLFSALKNGIFKKRVL